MLEMALVRQRLSEIREVMAGSALSGKDALQRLRESHQKFEEALRDMEAGARGRGQA